MWTTGLSERFAGLTAEQQARVQAELRPVVDSCLHSWGALLGLLDGDYDPEQVQRAYEELQALEEAETVQLRAHGATPGQVRPADPMDELDRLAEQGRLDQVDLKAMLEEVLEVAGVFGKPTKRVKTAG